MKLIAKRPIHIAGAWVQPGEPLPYGVAGFDYERADRKGQLDAPGGDEIVNPASTETELDAPDSVSVEEVLQANQDLKKSLDAEREEAQRLGALVNDGGAQVAGLTTERDQYKTRAEQAEQEREQLLERARGLEDQLRAAKLTAATGAAAPGAETPLPQNLKNRAKYVALGLDTVERLSTRTAEQLDGIEGVTLEDAQKALEAVAPKAEAPKSDAPVE